MNNSIKYEFAGTPGPWHAVQYACYWELHTEPFYGEKSLLNHEDCSTAGLNANLAASSPLLLSALIKAVELEDIKRLSYEFLATPYTLPDWYAEAKSAIEVALNLKTVQS